MILKKKKNEKMAGMFKGQKVNLKTLPMVKTGTIWTIILVLDCKPKDKITIHGHLFYELIFKFLKNLKTIF